MIYLFRTVAVHLDPTNKQTKTPHSMNTNTKQNIALAAFAALAISFAFGLTACGVVTLY
jgi:hypothetical protein